MRTILHISSCHRGRFIWDQINSPNSKRYCSRLTKTLAAPASQRRTPEKCCGGEDLGVWGGGYVNIQTIHRPTAAAHALGDWLIAMP
jgi:hypothetical protein